MAKGERRTWGECGTKRTNIRERGDFVFFTAGYLIDFGGGFMSVVCLLLLLLLILFLLLCTHTYTLVYLYEWTLDDRLNAKSFIVSNVTPCICKILYVYNTYYIHTLIYTKCIYFRRSENIQKIYDFRRIWLWLQEQ